LKELPFERKVEVEFRTDRTPMRRYSMSTSTVSPGGPQSSVPPVFYEMAEKTRAVAHGGVAMIPQIVVQSGLVEIINAVPVLKKTCRNTSRIMYSTSPAIFCAAARHLITSSRVGKPRRISTCLCFVRIVKALKSFGSVTTLP